MLPTLKAVVTYPTMVGLLPTKLTTSHAVLPMYFTVPHCELVVAVLLYNGEAIYMIESSKSPTSRDVLIFLQEGVDRVRDSNFGAAVRRGLTEELGLDSRLIHLHPEELLRFENHLPLERTGGVPTTKCICYFAARIPRGMRFTPNPKEIRRVEEVTADSYISCGCGTSRPEKCAAQTGAITGGVKAKLLGSSWASVVGQLNFEPAVT